MKIIIFGHKKVFTSSGGIEVVVTELAKRLAQTHEVVVLDRKEIDKKREKPINSASPFKIVGIPTFSWGMVNAQLYSLLATLYCILHKSDTVFIHAEGQCAFMPLLKLCGRRTVAMIHGLDWQRAKWGNFARKYIHFSERMAAKYADEIIVLSEDMQNYFQDIYNRDTKLVPNGISIHINDNTDYLNSIGVNKYDYLLYIGRFEPEKRLDLLVNGYWNTVGKSVIKPKLVLAGKENEFIKNAPWYEKARADENIIFTGFVHGADKEELLSNALLFILPSDLEGMSIALLEAMGSGIPVLASDIKENSQLMYGFGRTFAHGNQSDFDRVLADELLRETQRRDAVLEGKELSYRGITQINTIKTYHSWDAQAKTVEKILRGK